MIAAAIWSAVCSEGISYCVPPASFTSSGQKIRLTSDISQSLLANCLDTALLFASCLEQAGLNSVIALTKDHAMVGVWLVDESFPVLTSDDPIDLRNRIALKDLILFETTLATSERPIKFSQAIQEADRKIAEDMEHEFVYVLDIKQARSRKINPLNLGDHDGPITVEGTEKEDVELPPAPVLPPVVDNDVIDEEMEPADRVDLWRRKLLDLTKRNKLLNIRQRSMGFRILSPDLGFLEDELAAGKKYNVISRESLVTEGRSEDQFTQQTGRNLQAEFVQDQLHRGSLIADCNEKELEKNLINLFRRAKSDLEEGGSNTLFLAIGMLRWKEDARSDQSYRAPLILLPVKLDRTSARAKPKLRQLPDEGPVFNLTLIELLQQDFEIDLSIFQSSLPEDDSGIDIAGIWKTVRSKIKDTPGFEVVEDLVLSNFSFAKYLMWKDLSDRVDDLRLSPLVDHLIEKPADPYPHCADFIDINEVDEKIAPEKLYAPLNADSSQIVAIDASAKGVDFVLEGPPGTGKSETIANIISHNMAIGKKVLFVSEKMAALDVVYSRLKKVGLGHLCLELHSNKVSKKAVIDQLSESWLAREDTAKENWEDKAKQLASLRNDLNQYITHLHATSHLGYSARDAIARTTLYGESCRVELDWPMDLMTAPAKTKDDVKRIRSASEDLGLAFKDLNGVPPDSFSLINVTEWSNLWQASLISRAKDLNSKIEKYERSIAFFRATLSVELKSELSFVSAQQWYDLAQVVVNSSDQSHAFALGENSKELLSELPEYAKIKEVYDKACKVIGFAGKAEEVSSLPVKKWNDARITLAESGTILEQYKQDASILLHLKQKGLPISFASSPEGLSSIDAEISTLTKESRCPLQGRKLASLPIDEWIQKHNQSFSSQVENFNANKDLLLQLSTSGFKVSPNIIEDKETGLDSLQEQIDGLMSKSNCTLSPDAVVALPISSWLDMREEALKKGSMAQFFVKQKINKQMKQNGLAKIKDFYELDAYQTLAETLVRIQETIVTHLLDATKKLIIKTRTKQKAIVGQVLRSYSELSVLIAQIQNFQNKFKGDGILDRWSLTHSDIMERKVYGESVRSSVMKITAQVDEPELFMQNIRLALISRREFLESAEILTHAKLIIEKWDELKSSAEGFRSHANANDFSEVSFSSLKLRLKEIQDSAHSLNAWCHWTDAKNKAITCGIQSLVSSLECGLISCDECEEQFETALCVWLAPLLVDQSEVLRNFSATRHGNLIQKFRSLDEDVAKTTGQFVAAKLASQMPDSSGPNAPHEYGVLSREIQKKTRHKPVRQLVQELGEYLLSLTPCFMMSPLSVAQFLPSDYKAFDLVIFDEASQITVWDAVGAIARGKHVIVVGDPKQMPPTNFFNRSQEADDSDEADLESILDQAMAARVGYHRLTGHYRSRHESLIAFSNHQYYQNKLITYPCAETRESAVIWHRVEGLYVKGSGRNNPIEAQAVVAEVVRRLKDPELRKFSIGIVTFNTEQQRLILDLLDAERRKDTSLERFFKDGVEEPVFVKNLETVQGDQRDVIFLSVCYGPTSPEAQTMSMNFGPLNRQGGERRLNVAITRAATEMHVFTSFDASMIDLSRTSSEAVKDLKAYIDYAARGPIALAQQSDLINSEDQFDSYFEEAVALKLRAKGWQLRTQIGVSKFRIDLGVLNPDTPGSFLSGIECDGASYHSSPSARDRDRVRHIILENLGWKLIRIWSTDFFINPDKVIERVHVELENILSEYRSNQEAKQTEQKETEEVNSREKLTNSMEKPADEPYSAPAEEFKAENVDDKIAQVYCSAPAIEDTLDIEEYRLYDGPPLEDPRNVSTAHIVGGLIKIVEVEGPILAKRACDIYLRHCGIKRMGKDLRKLMRKALQLAIRRKQILKIDEWETGALMDTIIRMPDQPEMRFRTLGARTIDEIPPRELKRASEIIHAMNHVSDGSEEHLRLILGMYGLKRLTTHTRKKIQQALSADNESK